MLLTGDPSLSGLEESRIEDSRPTVTSGSYEEEQSTSVNHTITLHALLNHRMTQLERFKFAAYDDNSTGHYSYLGERFPDPALSPRDKGKSSDIRLGAYKFNVEKAFQEEGPL
jgi:hypothetical protein